MKRSRYKLPLVALLLCGALVLWLADMRSNQNVTHNATVIAASEPKPQTKPDAQPTAPRANSSKPLSDRRVEVHISVSLNAVEKTLNGRETLTWTNPGKHPVGELYLHLYPNAFASKKTTFLRESGGKLREDRMKKNSFGSMEIVSIHTVDGHDLAPALHYVQPDDGNKDDQTLAKVTLPFPVQPGKSVALNLDFSVKLPFAFARMGYAGDFVMAGQWFPKLAVYETAGMRGRTEEGWNLHQYHGNSEFYSDFGIYNVKITVPSSYTVAATGFPTERAVVTGDVKTYHFYAEDVHDFGWAASPHFVYVEEPFSTANVPGVKIKLYLDPAHRDLKDRYMRAAKKSLAKYGEWFGPYPYPTLSIVVPPADGNGAGGMEYPTLVTGWGAKGKNMDFELERVIVHEIGHQYWYGMVATNEFEEAWLDEGFTSYAEDLVMESEYRVRTNLPVESSYITSPAPLKQNAWNYRDHGEYADNVYTRAKLVLLGIEKQIGREQMQHVLQTYFQRWKFKHPSSRDFQNVVEEVTKQSWDDFFNQFVYAGRMTDYAVEEISVRKVQRQGKEWFENTVVVAKKGGSLSPVPIVFRFSDGTTKKEWWDGRDESVRYTVTHSAPLRWAAVDPTYSLVLENKHINNFLQTSIDADLRTRWNVGLASLLETLIHWVVW